MPSDNKFTNQRINKKFLNKHRNAGSEERFRRTGFIRGGLCRAGKTKNRTPIVQKKDKRKPLTGRACKRMLCNRRFPPHFELSDTAEDQIVDTLISAEQVKHCGLCDTYLGPNEFDTPNWRKTTQIRMCTNCILSKTPPQQKYTPLSTPLILIFPDQDYKMPDSNDNPRNVFVRPSPPKLFHSAALQCLRVWDMKRLSQNIPSYQHCPRPYRQMGELFYGPTRIPCPSSNCSGVLREPYFHNNEMCDVCFDPSRVQCFSCGWLFCENCVRDFEEDTPSMNVLSDFMDSFPDDIIGLIQQFVLTRIQSCKGCKKTKTVIVSGVSFPIKSFCIGCANPRGLKVDEWYLHGFCQCFKPGGKCVGPPHCLQKVTSRKTRVLCKLLRF